MKTHLPVKLAFVFTLRWDGADFFCTTKKLVCFVEECRETWGDIAWKQTEYEKYGAIYPKKGKAETENVDNMHKFKPEKKSRETGLEESVLSFDQDLYASML